MSEPAPLLPLVEDPARPAYASGSSQVLDLRPLVQHVPTVYHTCCLFAPILDLTDLELHAAALYGLLHTPHCFGVFPSTVVQMYIYCDGSYYHAKQPRTLASPTLSKTGWAFTVLLQLTPLPDGPYALLLSAAGLMFEDDLPFFVSTTEGNDVDGGRSFCYPPGCQMDIDHTLQSVYPL